MQPLENIENLIQVIRGKQVILDRDLARLYGVETRVLNQAVQRNIERFPADFMFQLSKEEFENWKSQFAISNKDEFSRSQIVTLNDDSKDLRSQFATSNVNSINLTSQIVISNPEDINMSSQIARTFETKVVCLRQDGINNRRIIN